MDLLMNKLKLLLSTAMLLVAQGSHAAECWITENYKGYTSRDRDGFEFVKDGMTSTKYVISIDGKNSRVVGSDITTYIQTAENSILAVQINEGSSVVETWSIFPKAKKALYTKTINGYGEFDGMTSFVGEVTGSCKSEKEIQ